MALLMNQSFPGESKDELTLSPENVFVGNSLRPIWIARRSM